MLGLVRLQATITQMELRHRCGVIDEDDNSPVVKKTDPTVLVAIVTT